MKKFIAPIGVLLCFSDKNTYGDENQFLHTPFHGSQSPFLLNLIDRPIIAHSMESMLLLGIKDFYILIEQDAIEIKKTIGDGSRWGCHVKYISLKIGQHPFISLKSMHLQFGQLLLITTAHQPIDFLQYKAFFPHLNDPSSEINENELTKSIPEIDKDASIDFDLNTLDVLSIDNDYNKPVVYSIKHNNQTMAQEKSAVLIAFEQLQNYHLADYKGWSYFLEIVQQYPCQMVSIEDNSHHLSCKNGGEFLASQQKIIQKKYNSILKSTEIEPGIWLSRNVVLHPTVKIIPPVHIGKNTRIESDVVLGPNVAIGDNCQVGNFTILKNTSVGSGVWLGEDLALDGLIVKPSGIWHAVRNHFIYTSDFFILSGVKSNFSLGYWLVQHAFEFVGRVTAFFLWTFTIPLHVPYAFYAIFISRDPNINGIGVSNPHENTNENIPLKNHADFILIGYKYPIKPIDRYDVKRIYYPLKVAKESNGLHHFFGWFLPGLWFVFTGYWGWIGLPPRTEEDYAALDKDWRMACRTSQLGLIDQAWVEFLPQAESWEKRISEMQFISKKNSMWHAVKLFFKYLYSLLR